MKKSFFFPILILSVLLLAGFSAQQKEMVFDIDQLYDYQKEFKSVPINVCAGNSTKTYMDYRATTARDSRQYWFIREELTVDSLTGFLYDKDGFIGVALGSFYGQIGDRYYFTLDNGVVLPLVKCEEKADSDTDGSGCYHLSDGSVIEFVIDRYIADAYFGQYGNGLVLSGNYNNYEMFHGNIVKVEKVLDERNEDYVTYAYEEDPSVVTDVFYYGSGY